MSECIFCKIVEKSLDAQIIYEDDKIMAFLDINPATEGHSLVIPKKHYENLFDVDTQLASYLFEKTIIIARSVKEAMQCDGINLVQSSGKAAMQTIFHFHIHIIPRYKSDKIIKPWTPLHYTQEELNSVAERIKQFL